MSALQPARLAPVQVHCEAVPEAPGATWSNALLVGDEIVMSGMTAHPATRETAGGLSAYEQTRVVLEKIRALVEAAGGDVGCITKLVVYVTDIADKAEVGRARREFFAERVGQGAPYPCSTLVQVSGLVFPELCVEIEACARLDLARATIK
ncbi:RidA family protein [Burkholderia perseverans]|uniref:RidA family protein n=1 Tax=Burkholderia perseverans TaxID=2615214 RepID=UPI001FEFE34F|nr:RidA family protein [Burkholderia perseverans]